MIVLDNSALIEYLTEDSELGRRVRQLLIGQEIAVPHSIDLECVSVLRRLVRHGQLDVDRATAALELFRQMALRRYDHVSLLPRIWELRGNMTSYDAAFAALAEQLGASLLTVDKKFDKTPGLRCQVLNLRTESD
ncbi:type II toxin-antitoxin system VapC family toxin [Glycomyces sp. NRRL B-16210]|uniref:type II toxin-antitoxin system VapC family toxin n=1 Tax=Glycomyces sp. NRRL B-16210 TaxID=1463821 RepID=UPI0004BF03C2|nr:type II toxin-antitoxin system VapC family toxin [Glycomyces sp. NRRL B-16210]